MVLHVGLREEIFARKHTATHKPTSAQPLSAPHSDQRDTHTYIHTRINRLWSPLAYGLGGKKKLDPVRQGLPPLIVDQSFAIDQLSLPVSCQLCLVCFLFV